jgi:hypothetical protein
LQKLAWFLFPCSSSAKIPRNRHKIGHRKQIGYAIFQIQVSITSSWAREEFTSSFALSNFAH